MQRVRFPSCLSQLVPGITGERFIGPCAWAAILYPTAVESHKDAGRGSRLSTTFNLHFLTFLTSFYAPHVSNPCRFWIVVPSLLTRRDNRLSSLRGLSGLPNLRELRLDINHLTSLHELENLPALVELSANTNHIRELPAGFAACLLSTAAPTHYPLKNTPGSKSRTAKSPLACSIGEWSEQGGLQRLDLYHNRIVSVHPRALDAFGSLTHLDLGRNQLETLDGRSLECCPSLSTLVLSQNLLREPPAPLRLPLLTELWLSGNRISSMENWATPPRLSQSTSPPGSLLSAPKRTTSGEPCASNLSSGRNGMTREKVTRTIPRANESKGIEREEINDGAYPQDNDEGMWLPSLEVLHLQDNMLETLGGVWSLAGCPLLRSLDASFNRLRTPRDFSSCLRACGDLQEVRLHDNPATEYECYADTVALGCPKVTYFQRFLQLCSWWWRATDQLEPHFQLYIA